MSVRRVGPAGPACPTRPPAGRAARPRCPRPRAVPRDPARVRRRARTPAGLLLLAALALTATLGACSQQDDAAGDPDLFCESAREAFTGEREFDFGDPAQRQQVLDVLDRMVEYAPGEIRDEAEATRDAVEDYADKVTELAQAQDELDATDGETLSEDAVAEIQDLVTEIEQSEDLAEAERAIEPYLAETCAIELDGGVTDAGDGATTETAPPEGDATTTTAP